MVAQNLVLVLIMSTAGAIASVIAWLCWQRKNTPGSAYFSLLMLAVAVFAFTEAGEFISISITVKITWSKLSYLGVVSVAPLWLLFALSYSQRTGSLTYPRIVLLWVVPLITLVLAFTNDWHGLLWPTITPISSTPGSRLIYAHGIAWWVHAGYAYLLMASGTYWLIRATKNFSPLQRRRVGALILAALFPWFGNLLYLVNLNPIPGLDLTLLGFVLTGLIMMFSIFRFRVFDLMPVAYEVVFNNMSDGVIVINNQNLLVDLNPVAKGWIGVQDDVVGKDAFKLLPLKEDIIRRLEFIKETRVEIEVGEGVAQSIYDLTISPLTDERGRLQGRIILLHDISREHNLLKDERRHTRQMELLNQTTRTALGQSDLHEMLQSLADQLGELFAADGAYVALWDEKQSRTIPAAAYGQFHDKFLKIVVEPGEKTLTETVLDSGQVLVIEDVSHSPFLSARIAALLPTRSVLALPLIVNERKLGAAIISFNHTYHFSAEEISLGEQAAAQISLAIYKTQLIEREYRRADQLEALQSISQAVTSSLELDQIFNTVVMVLHNTFKYPYVSIYLLDGDNLRMGAQVGYPIEMIYQNISLNQGIIGRAARTGQPQFIRDVSADPDFLRASLNVESEICVPLIKDQVVFGTLNVEDTPGHLLTETDLNLLITFASQVVIAIDNAQLYKAEREQRELAQALRKMGMAISESLDLESVLDRILEEIQLVIPYERGSVMLLDEERNRAHITRMRDNESTGMDSTWQSAPLEYKITSTANLRRMTETGLPLYIMDTIDDPDWKSDPQNATIRSWVGAPILLRGYVIGFLSLDKTQPNSYHAEHAERLSIFASQAAIAIENARIFTEMKNREEMERLLLAATRDFTAGLDTEAVLLAIVNHMMRALFGARCAIYRWDKVEDCIELLFNNQVDEETDLDDPGTKYNLAVNPLVRRILSQKHPTVLDKFFPIKNMLDPTLFLQFQTYQWLLLPLILGRQQDVFGIVGVSRKLEDLDFSDNDIQIAQSLTSQAAIALENAYLYRETQQLAIKDELTSLYNRRGLYEMGRREFERSVRFHHPLAAFFVDIDNFKNFNDAYSYAVGDQVLRLVAYCLRSNLRAFDVVGRYGGEEFVVLLPEADQPSVGLVAERIRQSVEELRVITDKGEVNITVSIGVVQKSLQMQNLDELLDTAGQASHEAKKRGRNQVVFF